MPRASLCLATRLSHCTCTLNKMTLLTLQETLGVSLATDTEREGEYPTVHLLTSKDEAEVMEFLAERLIHTVFLAGFIRDNGLVSPFNRGTFYGCRDANGQLEGVGLIGHANLIEARTEESLKIFARLARHDARARMIIGEEQKIDRFWHYFAEDGREPRVKCRELLLEQRWPTGKFEQVPNLRRATMDDLAHVVSVHAEMAFDESGINPLDVDPVGFRIRTARRVEQGRVWVLIEDGRLIFKADMFSDTLEVIYIEGVYVCPEERGKGYGTRCMMQMGRELLAHAVAISLLVNERNKAAIRLYEKAGYHLRSYYSTIYLDDRPKLK